MSCSLVLNIISGLGRSDHVFLHLVGLFGFVCVTCWIHFFIYLNALSQLLELSLVNVETKYVILAVIGEVSGSLKCVLTHFWRGDHAGILGNVP